MFCEISGYTADELIGQNHRIIRSGEHSPEFFKDLWQTIASGDIWHGDIKNRAKAGHYYWVSSTIVPVLNDDDEVTHYFSIRTDITSHKSEIDAAKALNQNLSIHQAELSAQYDELEQTTRSRDLAQRQYEALFNASCTAYVLIDEKERIIDFNRAFISLSEKTPQLLKHKHVRVFLRPTDRDSEEGLLDLHNSERDWIRANLWVGKDRYKPIRIGISQLEIEDRHETLLAIVDIAHEVKAEQAYKSSLEMKSRFVANMSHEIRTPLHGVVGNLSVVMDRGQLTPEDQDNVERAFSSGQHLTRVLDDILDYAKLEDGSLELRPSPIDLSKVIRDTAKQLSPLASTKGLSLRVFVEGDEISTVDADGQRFQQILMNLILNAIKFTETGGVTVDAMWHKIDESYTSLRLVVSDTGIGIYSDELAKIMIPFQQGRISRTKDHEGSGLGLNIVKSLTDMMRGTLKIDSVVGEGSRFALNFRFAISEDSKEIEAEGAKSNTDMAHTIPENTTCLLVDDSKVNLLVASEICKILGMTVHTAEDGEEAIDVLKSRDDIDIVLMDIQMPKLDGVSATKIIRSNAKWNDLPIIAVTANVHPDEVAEYLMAGMQGIVPKPFQVADLRLEIAKALSAKAKPQ